MATYTSCSTNQNGPVYDERITAQMRREGAIGREKWTTRADDVLYCIDLQTGRTRRSRRFAWQGVNIGAGFNKGGPNIPVIAHNTTIYCLGSAGNLYAVDALTGEVRWQNDNGPSRRTTTPLRRSKRGLQRY